MRRHEIDAVSLVAGLLFLVVAAVHIAARSTDTDLNLRWMVPAVLVLLGALGLLSAVRSPRGGDGDLAGPADHADVPDRVGPADHAETTEPVEPAVLGEPNEVSTER